MKDYYKKHPRSLISILIFIISFLLISLVYIGINSSFTQKASAACSSTADLGVATSTINVKTSGSYRLWVRIKAPNSTNNSVLVEVDGGNCYKVGDRSIPANSWTWVDYKDGNISNKTNISLSAGNHTIKLIGNEPDVQIDKVILTKDTNCIPVSSDDSCIPPPDSVKPSVSISTPTNGATASGALNISANATDNDGVKSVDFIVDGKVVNTDTTIPYNYVLDTTSLSDGTHSIAARATDTSDNVAQSSTVNVTVTNAKPDLIITSINWSPNSPKNGDDVLFNATVKNIGKAATPNATIIGVAFKIDGKTVAFSDTSTTPLLPNQSRNIVASGGPSNNRLWPAKSGSYTVSAIVDDVFRIAENDDNNNLLTTSLTVNSVDNTAPSVSIVNLNNQDVISDTTQVSVNAADSESGVSRVEFYIANKLVSTDSTAPYTYEWLTKQSPNGFYTIYAKAYDSAGNSSTSSNVVVEVSNIAIIPNIPTGEDPVVIPDIPNQEPVVIPDLPGSTPVEIPAELVVPIGDYDDNNKVDEFDLSVFFVEWKLSSSENLTSDFNDDGVVNVFDLSILLSNWSF